MAVILNSYISSLLFFLLPFLFHSFFLSTHFEQNPLTLLHTSPPFITPPPPPPSSFTHLFTSPSSTDYHLVIICSNEDEDKSHIISRLNSHRKHFTALHDDGKFQEYLKTHFTGATAPTHQSLVVTWGVSASMVDCEK